MLRADETLSTCSPAFRLSLPKIVNDRNKGRTMVHWAVPVLMQASAETAVPVADD